MAENQDTKKNLEYEGFKYTIDTNVVDDMDFLELSDAVAEGAVQKYPALVRLFIGSDQYDKLRDFMKKKYGRFTASKCGDFFDHTIKAIDPKD